MARFSDAQLVQILQKSARRLNRRLSLSGSSDEIVIDSSGSMTPSNADVYDLLLLQAECMLSSREFHEALLNGEGVSIQDGEQSLDTRVHIDVRSDYFNGKYGPCAEFEQALKLYMLNSSKNFHDIW